MEYNRQAAISYARQWALSRNPKFYDFEEIGGDCTNFASQCLYAGTGVMNFTPHTGWYYRSSFDRAAAWTSVEYFMRFMTTNDSAGPYGRILPLNQAVPGDFIQLSFGDNIYSHTLIILQTGDIPSTDNILIATHSYDSLDRPLNTYFYEDLRLIHIDGAR